MSLEGDSNSFVPFRGGNFLDPKNHRYGTFFADTSQGYFCTCIIDIVQSTKLISSISSSEKIRRYYSIFINSISTIAKKFGAKIIRNEGDSVICLFPALYDLTRNKSAYEAVIEFGLYIISYRATLSRHMTNEKLPSINYRVIADYGAVEMAKSTSSSIDELFGPFIMRCSNLKKISVPNSFVIGDDLYRLVKDDMNCHRLTISGENYLIQFEQCGGYSCDVNQYYRVHHVRLSKMAPDYASNRSNIEMGSSKELWEARYLAYPLVSDVVPIKAQSISSFELPQDDPECRLQEMLHLNSNHLPKNNGVSVTEKYNVMIIDDQPDIAFTYKTFLDTKMYNVTTFSNPYKALAHLSEGEESYYRLVILDIKMPGLNGLQLYVKIKQIHIHTKVLMLTAFDVITELSSLLPELREEDILTKPVEREYFCRKVEEILNDDRVDGQTNVRDI